MSAIAGSGPKVEAQIGKENTKVIGFSEQVAGDKKIVEKAETVTIQQTPPWVLFLLVLGWLLPSPNEIAGWFYRKKK